MPRFRRCPVHNSQLVNPLSEAGNILTAAKEKGVPFDTAWLRVMRAFSPPQDRQFRIAAVTATFEADRNLLRELRPYWQAAYESREVTAAEFERTSELTERRLDELMAA